MKKKLVSVIILSYKNLKYIFQAIDSTLSQDYESIELIIADDGSVNFNANIYEEYIQSNKKDNIKNVIVYQNTSNIGTVKSLNKAISLSRGDYIKWMAVDDIFYDNSVISKMVNFAEDNKSLVVSTNMQLCDEKMEEINISQSKIDFNRNFFKVNKEPKELLKRLARSNSIDAPGILYSRKLIDTYGLFDESYKLMEDWPTWIKLSRQGCKIDYFDIISVKYRYGVGVSTSSVPNSILLNDRIKCIEKEILSYPKEIGYWLHKTLNYQFIKTYKYESYNNFQKWCFLIKSIDVVIFNQFKKVEYKLKSVKA